MDSTEKRGIAMVERHGGRIDGNQLLVRTQDPVPAKLDIWDDYGSPVERIPVTDERWSWKGDWEDRTSHWGPEHVVVRTSSSKGEEATVAFESTSAIISGFHLPSGGKADTYLDGELDRVVDVYPEEDQPKGWESVWHDYLLEHGKHELRVVVRDKPYPGLTGSDIALTHVVKFRLPCRRPTRARALSVFRRRRAPERASDGRV